MNDLVNIKELLIHLSNFRRDDYQSWLEVGMALYHAGYSCQDWELWSCSSPKFKSGICEKKWATFSSSSNTLGIGSLVQWAKDDGNYNPRPAETEIIYGWDDPITLPHHNQKQAKNTDIIKYLNAVFKEDEYLNYVYKSFEKDGKFFPANKGRVVKVSELIKSLNKNSDITYALGDYNEAAGVWIRFNPINSSSEGSRNDDVIDFRHCLIESDVLSKDEQLDKIKALNLPCSAIVDSGGKSIHAIVRVDAGSDITTYKKRVQFLHKYLEQNGFIVDKACKNASRLSRMPAVFRGDNVQKLLGVNTGAKDYADWESSLEIYDYNLKSYDFDFLYDVDDEDKSDNLLGDRFLTREGSWLIVAQSGIGKSVLATQMAINFALGRSLWGIAPVKPLKIALLQAENCLLDLAEPLKSISKYMNLNEAERKILKTNFKIYHNSTECGGLRFSKLLGRISREFAPDIVIIDPLLSYIGGDISKQEVCSSFLRNYVHPVLEKYNLGVILMHHTPKPKGEESLKNTLNYAGAGSSELTNYVRAISTIIQNADDESVYNFTFSKRGGRLKEGEFDRTIYLKQADKGAIYWQDTTKPKATTKEPKHSKKSVFDDLGIENLPPMFKLDLDENLRQIFTEQGFDDLDKQIKKFYNNNRMSRSGGWVSFDKNTQKWCGTYYVEPF